LEVREIRLGGIAVEAAVLAILPWADTDTAMEARETAPGRMIQVWMAVLERWLLSMAMATALYRRLDTAAVEELVTLLEAGIAVAVALGRLLSTVAGTATGGVRLCWSRVLTAAVLAKQLSMRGSGTMVEAGGNLCGHVSHVCWEAQEMWLVVW
jgi:hypothetical protein